MILMVTSRHLDISTSTTAVLWVVEREVGVKVRTSVAEPWDMDGQWMDMDKPCGAMGQGCGVPQGVLKHLNIIPAESAPADATAGMVHTLDGSL